MPVELSIVESVTELDTTVVEVILESASTPGPAGPGVAAGGTVGQVLTKQSGTDYDTDWEDPSGGGGAHASTHEDGGADEISLTGLSGTPAALTTHEADTTNVHGITDTTVLATDAEVATAVSDHSADTTSVHGIADTSVLATDAEVATAVSDHSADTTSVHGIADTSVLATDAEVATAVSDHSADTTSVHGIADTSALALTANHPTNATFNDHSARHENGGADEVSVAGLSGLLADAQTPLSHNHAGEDITSGTVADARIASTIARDSEVATEIADQRRAVVLIVSDPNGDSITTGDGKAYFSVPDLLDGHNLVTANATVTGASSSGNVTVQVHNLTQAADMLSTAITIQASELHSKDGTPGVVDAANDDVAYGDLLRIDIDAAGTSAEGLMVILEFEAP